MDEEVGTASTAAVAADRAALAQLAAAYAQAWNDHDVDALVAMQADDMVFRLHLEGSEPTSGAPALRALYDFFFRAMPDYHADLISEIVFENGFVWQYTITATLAEPFPIGNLVGRPTGAPARFDAVDVLTCVAGKVATKHTWVDGFAMHRGMSFG